MKITNFKLRGGAGRKSTKIQMYGCNSFLGFCYSISKQKHCIYAHSFPFIYKDQSNDHLIQGIKETRGKCILFPVH